MSGRTVGSYHGEIRGEEMGYKNVIQIASEFSDFLQKVKVYISHAVLTVVSSA